MYAMSRPLWSAVRRDPPFEVVRHDAQWRDDPRRPLLIFVHPGDALEFVSDWDDREVGRAVAAKAMLNQAGMGREIAERLHSHDVVVLHRTSSQYLKALGVDQTYARMTAACNKAGVVLFGDDLKQTSAWLLDHAQLDAHSNVFMTGAYAELKYGCITALGKALQAAVEGITITVSSFAPTSNFVEEPRWNPAATAVSCKAYARPGP